MLTWQRNSLKMEFKGMDDISRYDDVLYSLLKDCGNLPNFLDIVFGFLSRRTDLYHVTKEQNSPIGLPEGYAEKFIKTAFFKWKNGGYTTSTVPPANVKENYEVISSSDDVTETEFQNNKPLQIDQRQNREHSFFTPSDYYNGSKFDHYAWSQTINELCVIIKVPDNVTPKMLDIKITSQTISVKLKGDGQILLKGDLRYKCKHSDVIWSLVGTKLDIQLEKIIEIWWDCLLTAEPKIDVQKIDCSRPFESLSESAQAKIEELQWNQERKRMGLPTSDNITNEKMSNLFNSHMMDTPDP